MLGFRKRETNIFKNTVENTKELLKELDEIIKKSEEVFDFLSNFIQQPKGLDEMVQLYSEATTRIIKIGKEKESLKFVGGNFKIELIDSAKVKLSMEAYFKSIDDKWVKKENSSMLSTSKFTEEAYQEIKKERLITYELVDPS